jgi:hypothetical protein
MNQVQEHYVKALAAFQDVEDTLKRKETAFLRARGRTEAHIWMIDDEEVFDRLNSEFADTVQDLDAARAAARATLKAAENALIAFALSVSPATVRETLRRGAERQAATREKLIDLTMRLG